MKMTWSKIRNQATVRKRYRKYWLGRGRQRSNVCMCTVKPRSPRTRAENPPSGPWCFFRPRAHIWTGGTYLDRGHIFGPGHTMCPWSLPPVKNVPPGQNSRKKSFVMCTQSKCPRSKYVPPVTWPGAHFVPPVQKNTMLLRKNAYF
jgi:hypothetical protein